MDSNSSSLQNSGGCTKKYCNWQNVRPIVYKHNYYTRMYTERVYSIATITTGSTHMIAGVGALTRSWVTALTEWQASDSLNHHDTNYTIAINDSFVCVTNHLFSSVSYNLYSFLSQYMIKKILHFIEHVMIMKIILKMVLVLF